MRFQVSLEKEAALLNIFSLFQAANVSRASATCKAEEVLGLGVPSLSQSGHTNDHPKMEDKKTKVAEQLVADAPIQIRLIWPSLLLI